MWGRRFLIFSLAAATALPVAAFERPFPQDTRRGTMTSAPYPSIMIDGKSRILAPGARIWNQENMIEMPASLRSNGTVVNYTEDGQGYIDRVWILTAEEAKRAPAKTNDNLSQ